MAELQTIAAIADLLRLCYEAGKIVKKVKDADKIALEISERIKRLECVLQGVKAALKNRDEHELSSGSDAHVAAQIQDAVVSCISTLTDLRRRLGSFDVPETQTKGRNFVDRVKVALRSTSIDRINGDLEARIHVLATELTVLQLFDQTRTSATISTNHEELLVALTTLGNQVSDGNEMLRLALLENRLGPGRLGEVAVARPSDDAVESLRNCLQTASNIHERFSERYTSEHLADDRSVRIRRVIAEQQRDSPFRSSAPSIAMETPSTDEFASSESVPESRPFSVFSDDVDIEGDEDIWPLEILNVNIQAYADRASAEREVEHFYQAELNLSQAIRNSQSRESHYGVPFEERANMMEGLGFLLMKQKKWAEAVTTIHQVIRESRSSSTASASTNLREDQDLVLARQHQLLASIYHDRYTSNVGAALSHTMNDVENAERHARRAFKIRWARFGSEARPTRPTKDTEQYREGIALLVRILQARDKHVEAGALSNLLLEGSLGSDFGVRRTSTSQSRLDFDVLDRHEILVEAIKSGDADQIHELIAAKSDLDVEKLCRQGKTLLMHAVESRDSGTVNKLLDPEVGAYVNTPNKRGLTALHLAAMSGLHEMAQSLIHYDADIEPKDGKGETPVVKAVQTGDSRMVEIFFSCKEGTLQTKGRDEWSLLHYAVYGSSKAMTTLLLDLAPDLGEAVDQAGKTALHHCAEQAKCEQALALLEHVHPVEVSATDSISRTPLFLAASKPYTATRESLVRLLLQKGAKIDDRKLPPRMRDYADLMPRVPRRDSTLSKTSVSTEGTIGTTSTGASRKSRWLGRVVMR